MDDLYNQVGNLMWGSADGRRNLIKDLETDHFVNILNWIIDRPSQYNPSLLPMFECYASIRAFELFTEGKNYPHQLESKRWVLVNAETGMAGITPPTKEYVDKVRELYTDEYANKLINGQS